MNIDIAVIALITAIIALVDAVLRFGSAEVAAAREIRQAWQLNPARMQRVPDPADLGDQALGDRAREKEVAGAHGAALAEAVVMGTGQPLEAPIIASAGEIPAQDIARDDGGTIGHAGAERLDRRPGLGRRRCGILVIKVVSRRQCPLRPEHRARILVAAIGGRRVLHDQRHRKKERFQSAASKVRPWRSWIRRSSSGR